MSTNATVSKRVGGKKRATAAKEELIKIFSDESHPNHFLKDTELAKIYDLSRHTIRIMRNNLNFKCRNDRILDKLKSINTKEYTIKELCALFNVKYQNLYKIITENRIITKHDVS